MMILHDSIIRQFIQDEPLDTSTYQVYPKPWIIPADHSKRKEVVMELHSRLYPILQQNSLFNIDLLRTLVSNCDFLLSNIHVHLFVHAPKPYDIYVVSKQDEHHIYIDLLQIADQSPIISRMLYIVQHELCRICSKICMQSSSMTSPKSYTALLNNDAFYNGFALLLSWNEDISTYNLQNSMYDEHKEKAFGMLYEAIQISDTKQQDNILNYLHHASFWNRFTRIASMFYLYDVYLESGFVGLSDIYDKKDDHFIQNIFQS